LKNKYIILNIEIITITNLKKGSLIMREKEFNNLPDSIEDFEFEITNEAACSAEFSTGCIFVEED
jgi:hypothetical protein